MTKYNGWSNYETWHFKLWLDNDEDLHNYIIGEIKKIKAFPNKDNKAYEVSNFLRSYIEDNMPNLNINNGLSFSSIAASSACFRHFHIEIAS